MDAQKGSESKNRTNVERTSDRELVVTRTFNGPVHIVYAAWTTPDLMKRWWVPRSIPMSMLSCEMDVRVGGGYRLVFSMEGHEPMAFFGKYTEVVPDARLVWTNEEGEAGTSVTTVTFEAKGDKTLVTVHELHPSKESLDNGAADAAAEVHDQLDELLATL